MTSQHATLLGRAGEFYCAYILEKRGIRTTHVDIPHDDLWCTRPDGQMVRVQVKTSSKPTFQAKGHKLPRYNFRFHQTKHGSPSRVVLLFADDRSLVLAMNRDDITGGTLKLKPDRFTKAAQEESLKRVFKLNA
tara:strand:+ start:16072 stop:16473 length:402 start_codon:yes stop_codon:yes gene_type:complete